MSSYTVITLGRDYRYCNSVAGDQRDNLCNDKRWCCAPEVNINEAHGCPFAGGVTCADVPEIASVNDLSPDTDFLWLFWPNVIYLFADIAIVLFFLGVFCVAPFPSGKKQRRIISPSAPPLDSEEQEDEERFVKKPPLATVIPQQEGTSSSISHRIHQATAALKYTKPE